MSARKSTTNLSVRVLATVLACTISVSLWAQSVTISTQDGVQLSLSPEGRITDLRIGGQTLKLTAPGGFFIADYKNQPKPKNIVPNPGFEEGGDGWNLTKVQTIDNEIFHSGKASVRIHVPGPKKSSSNVGRLARVEPNRRYRVSWWVRRQNCGVCGAYISQLDENGKFAAEPLQVGMSIPKVDDKWHRVTRDIETGPRTRQLLVRSDIYRSIGTIWLDDFSVTLLGSKLYLPVTGAIEKLSSSRIHRNSDKGRETRILANSATARGANSATARGANSATDRKLSNGGIAFKGGAPGAKLELSAQYVPEPGKIRVEAEVRDLSGEDRAISVAFRLPFDAKGWTWYDDTVDRRVIEANTTYQNTYNCESGDGFCSIYPLSALTNQSAGFSLGLPLAQGPRVFLLGYDNERKFTFLNFYFGLSKLAKKQPSRAEFSFVLYRHDPKWGMRSALQRYYKFHPESFKKHPPFEGFLNYANLERFDPKTHRLIVRGPGEGGWEDASDFGDGYRFLWHLHGCYDFRMVQTEQRERLSDEAVLRLLHQMVETERSKPRSYCPTEHTLKKLVYDHRGDIRYIGDTRYWEPHQGYNRTDKPGWGLNFRVNEDPEVSDALANKTRQVLDKYSKEGGRRPFQACLTADAIEGYFCNSHGLDYRREHIAVADLPLTFGERNLQPAICNTIWDFHKTVWQPLTEKYKVAAYGNANGYEQIFILPFVDVPMIEWDWDRARPGRFERYCRIVAHHKIWRFWRTCGKGEADPESVLYHFRRGLAYAIYPAVYPMKTPNTYRAYYRQYVPAINALSVAGWEPITYADTDDAVVVERYGSFKTHNLHFTLRNYSMEAKQITMTLDGKGLGVPETEARSLLARDLLSGGVLELSSQPPALKTTVEANGSAAFWVGTRLDAMLHALHQTDRGLSRIERFFATELTDSNRQMLAECRQIAVKETSDDKLFEVAKKLHDTLDQLEPAINTRATVDRAKIFYRIKSELSTGVAARLNLKVVLPRLVKAPQGGSIIIEGKLIYGGKTALTSVKAELLSPTLRNRVFQKDSVSLTKGPVSSISLPSAESETVAEFARIRGRVARPEVWRIRLSLSAKEKPQRKLLPFLLAIEGSVDGQHWRVDAPIDVEIVPALSVSLVAPRLFPGAKRSVNLVMSNASRAPAKGKLKFGAVNGLDIRPAELNLNVPPQEKAKLSFNVSVAQDAKPGPVQIPVSTICDDDRFVMAKLLSVKLVNPVPQVEVYRAPAAPRIDGEISDATWQKAPIVPELIALASGKEVMEKTSVWMTYDDAGIYIAFRCEESNMPGISAQYVKRGAPLYKDDDVEVFILPPGQPAATQLAVNALGAQSDNIGNLGPWRAAARKFDDHWTTEVFAPYSVLKLDGPPKAGGAWGFQFGRQQKSKKETSAWTICPYFNAPDRFGEIVFR